MARKDILNFLESGELMSRRYARACATRAGPPGSWIRENLKGRGCLRRHRGSHATVETIENMYTPKEDK